MSEPSVKGESLESLVARIADEFAERCDRGERPDPEEYAQQYPEAAELIRGVLGVVGLVGPSLSASGAAPGEESLSGTLGDYRIVREVGRGGMGVVYEAEQISLRRRVTLKVLPFAAMLDARRLQRFENEARAAASLHHDHVVPVYAVGCERGIHFYAMQFVDGRTLAEVIAARRRAPGDTGDTVAGAPSTVESEQGRGYHREVARLGVEAAEALEHAHQLGVVHRDVKPANLMVDGAGKLWVTDFGLARLADGQGVTVTGDVLGTLRYASPEQGLGKPGVVDHRSDVYSLGVTLYELLTLRPAVAGNDREELLRNLTFEEPVRPRKLDPSIPADLETVVLKATAKEPTERYASARELADDLRRFLDDTPVQARRPGLTVHALRWARRRVGLVVLVALSLIFASVALAVGALYRVATAQAHAAEEKAEVQAFYRLLSETNQQVIRREPGWTWKVLDEVRRGAWGRWTCAGTRCWRKGSSPSTRPFRPTARGSPWCRASAIRPNPCACGCSTQPTGGRCRR